ncbi:MAG: DJ-1 family protein [Candidatus Nealsonbacteria bacterium CG_4_10_14_0_2_um_filter_38_17]|uniref:DJ-1 family protein n=2 Tax=Candidatus Nealsoniibacteriota TaxID=1817911 RepID=A0A2M7UWX2_9BACT|nr:MAG: thiamine biosynthesis protein ThiJ [Candidatus Nealsonbacteria bacterium CG23_combo_of_CG06-09_8_20_14_all_38_19]PIZ88481.1 MAG: DJ-1 family protein [Candidatus Nealsonbacteria bacterium CG_4_10_14_0_2_um_filter_38_17]
MRNIILSPTATIISFLSLFAIVLLVGVWAFVNLKSIVTPASMALKYDMSTLQNKSIVIIVAFRDFRDEEYFVPKEILEQVGADIKTASNQKGTAIGADGGEVNVDFLVSEIKPENFDAIVFIGGPGALEYLDNEDSYKLAKETVANGKVLSAICIAPAILAKAGVLQGKNATVWSSAMDKSAVKILKDNGAIYQNAVVVTDGKIVTGNGPQAAEEFAEALIRTLTAK